MTFTTCSCIYKALVDTPVSLWSTIMDFLFSVIIAVFGEMSNYRFMRKLREEKRTVPLGRKGNVIEPIMSVFCKLQMIYWPYHLLYYWIAKNQIIPFEYMNGWWCKVALLGIKIGRMCIAYNSISVALIRYIYIVHQQKSSLWEFSKVGRYFKISSIAIPFGMEIIGTFTSSSKRYFLPFEESQPIRGFKECIDVYDFSNDTVQFDVLKSYPLEWTLQIIPERVVLVTFYIYIAITVVVYLNVAEVFLYLQIYRSLKRTNDNSYSRGVLSERSYASHKNRNLISLKMCFMAWVYELFSIASSLMTPLLQRLGIPNIHSVDAIIMFVVIPFCHLMNDEETKEIINEESWYEGIRHMLGIYVEKPPQNVPQAFVQPPQRNVNPSQHNNAIPQQRTAITPLPKNIQFRHCNSFPNLLTSKTSKTRKIVPFKRRYSFTDIGNASLSITFEGPDSTSGTNPGAANITAATPRTVQIQSCNESPRAASMTSLSTIHITK